MASPFYLRCLGTPELRTRPGTSCASAPGSTWRCSGTSPWNRGCHPGDTNWPLGNTPYSTKRVELHSLVPNDPGPEIQGDRGEKDAR
jgi:hypothetical protein